MSPFKIQCHGEIIVKDHFTPVIKLVCVPIFIEVHGDDSNGDINILLIYDQLRQSRIERESQNKTRKSAIKRPLLGRTIGI